ncbi:MAG: antitoxin [Pseudonocardia sp.]|nr:antitoxin [Pseudonocardia sp.]MBO0872711.1 antitoxin [Pseudonocardia sp.]
MSKAKDLLGKHDDKVDETIDKGGEAAKKKFEGHDEQIDKLTQAGKDYDFSGGQQQQQAAPPPSQPSQPSPPSPPPPESQ